VTTESYLDLKARLIAAGYAGEIDWSENIKAPEDAGVIFNEYAWVVINSGMKEQVARKIWEKVQAALRAGLPVSSAFRHPGKAAAIQQFFDNRELRFAEYKAIPKDGLLSWIHSLPWIGGITQHHLAKNLGVDCAKPDRHLERIAQGFGLTVDALCCALARATGDRIATVDLVIWRAANLGWV
jgi:hypothetical protein